MPEKFNDQPFDRDQWLTSMDDQYLELVRTRPDDVPFWLRPDYYRATISYDGFSQSTPLAYGALYYKVMRRDENLFNREIQVLHAEADALESVLAKAGCFRPLDMPDVSDVGSEVNELDEEIKGGERSDSNMEDQKDGALEGTLNCS